MAYCKNCGANIPDGMELCEECAAEAQDQEIAEEYLDNLLGGMNAGSALERLQKKKAAEVSEPPKQDAADTEPQVGDILGESSIDQLSDEFDIAPDQREADSFQAEIQDEEEIDVSDMEGLDDIDFDSMEGLDDIDFDSMEDLDDIELDDIALDTPQDDEAGLEDIALDALQDDEAGLKDIALDALQNDEAELDDIALDALQEADAPEAEDKQEETIKGDDTQLDDKAMEDMAEETNSVDDDMMAALLEGEAAEETASSDDMDAMLDQLLDDLDQEGSVGAKEEEEPDVSSEDLEKMMDEYKGSDDEQNDLDELLSMVGEAETEDAGEDTMALEEGFSEEDLLGLEGFDEADMEGLEDLAMDDDITAQLGGLDEDAMSDDVALDALLDGEEEIALPPDPEERAKKKKNAFAKIFGNIVTDEIAKEEMEQKKAEEEEELKKAEEKKAKEEQDAIKKEEKKAEKEAKKAEKKAQKEAAKKEKEAKKAEKKAQKEAERQAEEQEVEVVGKLNKLGVGIVMVVAAVFLVFVILGTKNFSYSTAMADAKEYYENKRYAKAYEEMVGLKIKKKDQEFYDKVVTIMRVYRQIDSYGVYKSMKRFPEALDALLKGLKRYNTYYEDALYLEVENDMDACKEQITQTLKDEFGLTEEKAYELAEIEDQEEYNEKVVDLAVEQMKQVMEESKE